MVVQTVPNFGLCLLDIVVTYVCIHLIVNKRVVRFIEGTSRSKVNRHLPFMQGG